MRGLDTRGLADGFVQGFGLMERHQQRGIDNERADRQEQRQARFDEMRETQFENQQEDRAKAQSIDQVRNYWAAVESGLEPEITPDVAKAFELHPMMAPQTVLDPRTEQAVQVAEQVALGDMDPNSPEGLAAFNQLFSLEVSAGDADGLADGQRAVKRIAGVYPGSQEGTVVFELDVDVVDADGNVVRSYKAPMTPNHAAGDDEILQVPIETLVNRAVAMKNVQRAIPPEVRERQMSYLRRIGILPQMEERWEQIQGPGGSVLQRNATTGEMKQVVGRESRYGLGGMGGAGAIQKDMEYLRSLYPEAGPDELMEIYRRGKGFDRSSGGDSTLEYSRIARGLNDVMDRLQVAPDDPVLIRQRDMYLRKMDELEGGQGLRMPASDGATDSSPESFIDFLATGQKGGQQSVNDGAAMGLSVAAQPAGLRYQSPSSGSQGMTLPERQAPAGRPDWDGEPGEKVEDQQGNTWKFYAPDYRRGSAGGWRQEAPMSGFTARQMRDAVGRGRSALSSGAEQANASSWFVKHFRRHATPEELQVIIEQAQAAGGWDKLRVADVRDVLGS